MADVIAITGLETHLETFTVVRKRTTIVISYIDAEWSEIYNNGSQTVVLLCKPTVSANLYSAAWLGGRQV